MKVTESMIVKLAKAYANAGKDERNKLLAEAGIHRTTMYRAMERFGVTFFRVVQ